MRPGGLHSGNNSHRPTAVTGAASSLTPVLSQRPSQSVILREMEAMTVDMEEGSRNQEEVGSSRSRQKG
ncbi:hypothetical protein LXL04_004103 [Taraxacum kok-saghyz]